MANVSDELFDEAGQPNYGAHFDGSDYEPELDDERLTGQIRRVYAVMRDHEWRTLGEIARETQDPPASISAQLRHLRKKRFGAYPLEKRQVRRGLWEYRLGEKGEGQPQHVPRMVEPVTVYVDAGRIVAVRDADGRHVVHEVCHREFNGDRWNP
jgi:hypothetical protein